MTRRLNSEHGIIMNFRGSQLNRTMGTLRWTENQMTGEQVSQIRKELLREYPGANIKVTDDRAEMVAEIEPGRAVAVIERSLPHFHRKMIEVYRVLRGTLYVACG